MSSSRLVKLRKSNYEKVTLLAELRNERVSEIVNFALARYFERLGNITQKRGRK